MSEKTRILVASWRTSIRGARKLLDRRVQGGKIEVRATLAARMGDGLNNHADLAGALGGRQGERRGLARGSAISPPLSGVHFVGCAMTFLLRARHLPQ